MTFYIDLSQCTEDVYRQCIDLLVANYKEDEERRVYASKWLKKHLPTSNNTLVIFRSSVSLLNYSVEKFPEDAIVEIIKSSEDLEVIIMQARIMFGV